MLANTALDSLLNTYFRAGTPPTALYVGLVDLTNLSEFAASDTMASHAGWQELTSYSQATRPAWSPPSSTAELLQNSAAIVFTTNAPCSIYGVFLTTDSTKGGTGGTLIGPIALDTVQVLPTGEDFKVYLALQAQSG